MGGKMMVRTRNQLLKFLKGTLKLSSRTANVLARYQDEWVILPCCEDGVVRALLKGNGTEYDIRSIHNMGVNSTKEAVRQAYRYMAEICLGRSKR